MIGRCENNSISGNVVAQHKAQIVQAICVQGRPWFFMTIDLRHDAQGKQFVKGFDRLVFTICEYFKTRQYGIGSNTIWNCRRRRRLHRQFSQEPHLYGRLLYLQISHLPYLLCCWWCFCTG